MTTTKQKSMSMAVRTIDTAARAVDCVASTSAIDSYGESVDSGSWDLSRFAANPVVLFAHDSRSLPVGRAENVRVEGGALRARIVFADERANPEAEKIWRLVQAKMLNAVSVGFIPATIRSEKRDGQDITVLADCALYELSVVPIPANEEATMRMRAAGLLPTTDTLSDLGVLLETVDSDELVAFGLDAAPQQHPTRPTTRATPDNSLGELLLDAVDAVQQQPTQDREHELADLMNGAEE